MIFHKIDRETRLLIAANRACWLDLTRLQLPFRCLWSPGPLLRASIATL